MLGSVVQPLHKNLLFTKTLPMNQRARAPMHTSAGKDAHELISERYRVDAYQGWREPRVLFSEQNDDDCVDLLCT